MKSNKIIHFIKSKNFILFLGLIALIILFHWNSYTMPFERDEGEYAYGARLLLNGDLPYQDAFMQKPPMILYTFALSQLIFGDTIWGPRILLSLAILGISLLVGYVAQKEYGPRAGLASVYISIPLLSLPYLAPFAANTEIFMLLPLLGAMALFVQNQEDFLNKFWPAFWASFLTVVSVLYKPIAIFTALFLIFFWLVRLWQKNRNWKDLVKIKLAFLLGTLTSLLIFLSYFLFKDGGKSLWDIVVIYNLGYAKWVSGFGSGFFVIVLQMLWNRATPLYIFLATFLMVRQKNWFLYFGLLVVSALTIYKVDLNHYFLFIMPFVAITTGSGLAQMSEFLEKHLPTKKVFIVLVAITMMFLLGSFDELFTKTPDQIAVRVYGDTNPFIESIIVAKKINELTTPEDRVFISGSEPQILYYADRESASRFVITYPLVIHTPYSEAYQKETIAELQENNPRSILVVNSKTTGSPLYEKENLLKSYLETLLNTSYTPVGAYMQTLDLMSDYEERGQWVEKNMLDQNNLKKYIFVLYQKSD